MRMRGLYESLDGGVIPKLRPSTLVIYVFSKTDLEYERNLQFFVQHGMWEGDGCDYAIIVQQVSTRVSTGAQQASACCLQIHRSMIFWSLAWDDADDSHADRPRWHSCKVHFVPCATDHSWRDQNMRRPQVQYLW